MVGGGGEEADGGHGPELNLKIGRHCKIVRFIAKLREDRVRVRQHSSLFSPYQKGEIIMSEVN